MREVRNGLLVLGCAFLIGHIIKAEEPTPAPIFEPELTVVPAVAQPIPLVTPFVAEPRVTPPRVEKKEPKPVPKPSPKVIIKVTKVEYGAASIYDEPQGTAFGKFYDGTGLVTAHRTAPEGQYFRVTCLRTGKSVIVRCHDHGPWIAGRIIDISPGAGRRIGLPGPGKTEEDQVKVEWITYVRQ